MFAQARKNLTNFEARDQNLITELETLAQSLGLIPSSIGSWPGVYHLLANVSPHRHVASNIHPFRAIRHNHHTIAIRWQIWADIPFQRVWPIKMAITGPKILWNIFNSAKSGLTILEHYYGLCSNVVQRKRFIIKRISQPIPHIPMISA